MSKTKQQLTFNIDKKDCISGKASSVSGTTTFFEVVTSRVSKTFRRTTNIRKDLRLFFLANFNSFFFLQSTILFQTSKSLLKVDILSRELGGEMVATLLVEDGFSPGTNNLFN
jgi:hypothetical protein